MFGSQKSDCMTCKGPERHVSGVEIQKRLFRRNVVKDWCLTRGAHRVKAHEKNCREDSKILDDDIHEVHMWPTRFVVNIHPIT